MTIGWKFITKEIVKVCVKSTFCYYTRVLALESSRCGITWVRKWSLANLLTLCIKSVEVIPGKKYLSTNFE